MEVERELRAVNDVEVTRSVGVRHPARTLKSVEFWALRDMYGRAPTDENPS